jgi:hypothetical protein
MKQREDAVRRLFCSGKSTERACERGSSSRDDKRSGIGVLNGVREHTSIAKNLVRGFSGR